jgi:hypothetical protein
MIRSVTAAVTLLTVFECFNGITGLKKDVDRSRMNSRYAPVVERTSRGLRTGTRRVRRARVPADAQCALEEHLAVPCTGRKNGSTAL